MGKESVGQKYRFVGDNKGPLSAYDVYHVVNFKDIRDVAERHGLVQEFLNGAEKAGHIEGFFFINIE